MDFTLSSDARVEASNVMGWLSIGCWLIVYTPQIYENYTRKSGEGLSVAFIITWLLGDLFSLVGAIMAGLIPTVILLALYYALCDMTLLFQIFYYRIFYSSRDHLDVPNGETSPLLSDAESIKPSIEPKRSQKRIIVEYALLWCFVFTFGIGAFLLNHHKGYSPEPEGSQAPSDVFEWKSQVLGWASALLYLGSRFPQIQKNTETRCEGLSPALFMFTIGGNAFFVVSICVVSMRWHYLLINASWLAGSGLAVFLDFFVLGQFLHFHTRDKRGVRLQGNE